MTDTQALLARCKAQMASQSGAGRPSFSIADFQALLELAESLTRELAMKDEALRDVANYQWPVIAGHHEYSTFGQATGNEYRHRMAYPKEQASGAIKSMQRIARAALTPKASTDEQEIG